MPTLKQSILMPFLISLRKARLAAWAVIFDWFCQLSGFTSDAEEWVRFYNYGLRFTGHERDSTFFYYVIWWFRWHSLRAEVMYSGRCRWRRDWLDDADGPRRRLWHLLISLIALYFEPMSIADAEPYFASESYRSGSRHDRARSAINIEMMSHSSERQC